MHITNIHFSQYKGLVECSIRTTTMTVVTGENNAGKSTFLSALRLLDAGLQLARRRKPHPVVTHVGRRIGYLVPTENLAVSIKNIHTDLKDVETIVDFDMDNGVVLTLYFPVQGGCIFFVQGMTPPMTPTTFRSKFRFGLIQIPVLGPLEDDEPLVLESTIKRGLGTHRASRHFRNYWYRNPQGFDDFSSMVSSTWEGMNIELPEMTMGLHGGILHMYCTEFRRTRELYWCGFGFQIWCQLLTHISRAAQGDIILVDEPETYLHPTVQKQLLEILRSRGAQVFLATHSPTIISCAKQGEVIGISRFQKSEIRYKEVGIPLCQRLGLLPQ